MAGKAPRKKAPATTGASSMTTQQRMQVLQSLIGRTRFLNRMAGVQYAGKRDIFASAGYVSQGLERYADYWGLYDRGDIGGRIVDMPAKTTWRTPPSVIEEIEVEPESAERLPDGDVPVATTHGETPFTTAFDALAKRLRLWHYFGRVDRLAGIGRYAVIYLGTRGVEDAQLRDPIETLSSADDLIYLSVYSEQNAKISAWEMNPANPRFGQPALYTLTLSRAEADTQAPSMRGQSLVVHSSRVIHVAEDLLEDDVFGRPRLKRVMNRLFDLEKVAASTGEAYWQLVSRILQASVDPEAEIDDDTLKVIDERLEEMVHDLRRQFTGQGVDLKWLQSETPNVSQVADFFFSLIAGAAGIPKRILFGSELGQLASSTDQETYLGMINERQEQFVEPQILRAFIDRLIGFKALPKPQTGEYHIVWPTLFEASEKEAAEANLARAQTASTLTPVGGNPMELCEIDEDRNVWLVPRGPAEPAALPEEPIVAPDGTEGADPNMPAAIQPPATSGSGSGTG